MSDKIKSYKLSPQLKAELNFPRKRDSAGLNGSSMFSQKSKFKFDFGKIKINWRAIGSIVGIFVLIIGGYISVKKIYDYSSAKNEQARVVQLQNYQQHVKDVSKEVATQATDAYSFATLSQKYIKEKDAERAEAAANLAVQKDPKWRDGFINQGQILLSVNKFDEAKTAFENALKIDPIYGQTHYLLSLTYQELNNNELAKAEFAKAKQFGFETEIGG
ncbi:MAG: hypothetical protein NTZ65_00555 [Candidatus Berkelbacteria bacterium]|nr:hypothetical protein [Candidatus Berkelbacteria bacterium]